MTSDRPEEVQRLHKDLEFVTAQLRHAYHNLIGFEAAWDREQRLRFADGLIAPQIVKLEAVLVYMRRLDRQRKLQGAEPAEEE